MNTDILRRIGLIIVFALAQGLVLGNIHLFNCATPLLYVYFALLFPRNYPRWASLVMCFCLGLAVDCFCNTPGLAAASLTLVGFVQPYVLELYLGREDEDDYVPSLSNMGWMKYSTYTLFLTLIFCLAFFSLEAFSFFNWIQWLSSVLGSYFLTIILILVLEMVRK